MHALSAGKMLSHLKGWGVEHGVWEVESIQAHASPCSPHANAPQAHTPGGPQLPPTLQHAGRGSPVVGLHRSGGDQLLQLPLIVIPEVEKALCDRACLLLLRLRVLAQAVIMQLLIFLVVLELDRAVQSSTER